MCERIETVFEDEDLLVVKKPPGLLVHRTRLAAEESETLLRRLEEERGEKLHPCHRLDRATSGLILLSRNRESLLAMNEQFAAGAVKKSYLALVRGWILEEGEVDYPLVPEDERGLRQAQEALTRYEPLRTWEIGESLGRYTTIRLSLLRLEPSTGRRHQLRRHLAHLRHPIYGDTTHGDGKQNAWIRKTFGCHRLMLCSTVLRFSHPVTAATVTLEEGPDESFQEVLDSLDSRRLEE